MSSIKIPFRWPVCNWIVLYKSVIIPPFLPFSLFLNCLKDSFPQHHVLSVVHFCKINQPPKLITGDRENASRRDPRNNSFISGFIEPKAALIFNSLAAAALIFHGQIWNVIKMLANWPVHSLFFPVSVRVKAWSHIPLYYPHVLAAIPGP